VLVDTQLALVEQMYSGKIWHSRFLLLHANLTFDLAMYTLDWPYGRRSLAGVFLDSFLLTPKWISPQLVPGIVGSIPGRYVLWPHGGNVSV